MPLVFGGAPVINAFLSIYMTKRLKEIGPLFLAGLIMVVLGAVCVLTFAPKSHAAQTVPAAATESTALATAAIDFVWQLLAIALVVVCWGSYGPVLHRGQLAMGQSRMRPLICVGLAYFAIAVLVPNVLLPLMPEASHYSSLSGTFWSLAAGAAGALGALGIILAFNFGGKPIFVMPLVFGGAPVVNTLFTATTHGLLGELGALFLAGLILVIAGAAMVLIFAPRGEAHGHAPPATRPAGEPAAAVLGNASDDGLPIK
jgi:hypothetical protein